MAEPVQYALGILPRIRSSSISSADNAGTTVNPLHSSTSGCLTNVFASYHIFLPCIYWLSQGLARLEELVRKVMDIMDNRVVANLQLIQTMVLVELPADRCGPPGRPIGKAGCRSCWHRQEVCRCEVQVCSFRGLCRLPL